MLHVLTRGAYYPPVVTTLLLLHVVTTGAYYPPVVTTWKILTTGASQLTAGPLCNAMQSTSTTTFTSSSNHQFRSILCLNRVIITASYHQQSDSNAPAIWWTTTTGSLPPTTPLEAAQNFNVIFVFFVSISPWLHLLAGKRWDDLMGALKVFGKFWVHSKFLAN